MSIGHNSSKRAAEENNNSNNNKAILFFLTEWDKVKAKADEMAEWWKKFNVLGYLSNPFQLSEWITACAIRVEKLRKEVVL